MAPDYDHLTLMQKVEVFEHAVNNTAGDDLAKLLWLKSPSSEVSATQELANSRVCNYLLCRKSERWSLFILNPSCITAEHVFWGFYFFLIFVIIFILLYFIYFYFEFILVGFFVVFLFLFCLHL